MKPPTNKIWYQFVIHVCPVCGRARQCRFKMEGIPKPGKYEETHIEVQVYDGCGGY